MAENFKTLHESLAQYKFYYDSVSFLGLDSGRHDNYIENTIEVFNEALTNYENHWIKREFSEAKTTIQDQILERDRFFNETYIENYIRYNPSLMNQVFSKDFLKDPNKYKDLIMRLLFFAIYDVTSDIGNWDKNDFDKVILPTFSSFDYFNILSESDEYITAAEAGKITLIYDHIYDFFDELAAKIDNIFEDLKFYIGNPFVFPDIGILAKYKFYYDSTDETDTSYNALNKLISTFKSEANYFKNVKDSNVEIYRTLYTDKIISKGVADFSFLEEDDTNKTIGRKNLAIRTLWHSLCNINVDAFIIKTFSRFDYYGEIITENIEDSEKVALIKADLLDVNGGFFAEFAADVDTYFKSLEPVAEDYYYIKLDEGISERFYFNTTENLSKDDFNPEIKFYKHLSNEYKKAKRNYVDYLINYLKKEGKELEEYLINAVPALAEISSSYLENSIQGVNSGNADPYYGGYKSLASKYIYYIFYTPKKITSQNEERSKRDIKYTLPFVKKFFPNAKEEEEESFLSFYYGFIYEQLLEEIKKDFKNAYEKEKKINDKTLKSIKNTSKIFKSLLPYGFDKKFTLSVPEDKNYEKLVELFETWKTKLSEYEEVLLKYGKNSTPIGIRRKEMLEAISNEPTINSGKIYNEYLNNIDTYPYIVAKLAFFYIFLISNESIKDYPVVYEVNTGAEVSGKTYTYSKRESKTITGTSFLGYKIELNNKKYTVKDLFKEFLIEASRVLNDLENEVSKYLEAEKVKEEKAKNIKRYEEFLQSIKTNLYTEKNYFYLEDLLGNKTIPTTPAIDIEFRTYDKNYKEIWVSVSKRNSKGRLELNNGLFHENYFDRMVFDDTGGKKEISISLKAIDDINLERIILNSMLTPVNKFNNTIKNNNSEIENVVRTSNFRMANFRVRFGYNDISLKENTVIDEKEITSDRFSSRIKNNIPVIKTPWLYFLINKLDTNFTSESITFDIGGLNVGSYMLDEFRIYSKNPTDNANKITAEEAVARVAEALFDASDGTICILAENSSKKGTVDTEWANNIVVGYENGRIITEKVSITGKEENSIKGSDFNFEPFHIQFVGDAITPITAKTFNTDKQKDEENEEETIPTARKILDDLVDFLPTRLYAVPSTENYKKTAVRIDKKDYNVVKDFARELKMSYEIIECESVINQKIQNKNSGSYAKKRRTFIRLYYKGPNSKDIESDERTRFYQYRGNQNSVVKNLRIENPIDFQKIYGVIGAFQSNEDALFYTSKISTSTMSSGILVGEKKNLNLSEWNSSFFVPKNDIKNTDYTSYDDLISEDKGITEQKKSSASLSKISSIANDLTRYTYEGELEILGDPYYIFDDDLEPWTNLIYLKINRYKNIKNEELADEDYYSGLYTIKKINHEITSSGEFTTRLGIVKFTMADSEDENTQLN